VVIREIKLFIFLLFFLAISMYFHAWIDHPVEHLMALSSAGSYSIMAIHPLFFIYFLYIFCDFKRGCKIICEVVWANAHTIDGTI